MHATEKFELQMIAYIQLENYVRENYNREQPNKRFSPFEGNIAIKCLYLEKEEGKEKEIKEKGKEKEIKEYEKKDVRSST